MKNLKTTFAVLCLSAAFGSAHAQEFAGSESANFIGIYASSGIYATSEYGYPYAVVGTYVGGSGSAYSFSTGTNGQYAFALNEAFSGPGAGYAVAGQGFAEFVTLTNENANGLGGYFTFYSALREFNETTANGFSTSYGGIQEFGGSYFVGFNTVYEDGGAVDSLYTLNWTVNYNGFDPSVGESYVVSHGSFSDYLAFGQSVTIIAWSSGVVQASSTGSSVPAPAAVAPFALGLVGALRRRNKKS